MPTIRPLDGGSYTFLDILDAMDGLITSSFIEDTSPVAFTAYTEDSLAGFGLSYEVYGRGFSFDFTDPGFAVTSGIVEDVLLLWDDEPFAEITDVGLEIDDVARAYARDVVTGTDIDALEGLILDLGYDYRGTGLDEVALSSFTNPDDVFFDPGGDDVFDLGDGQHEFYSGGGDDELYGGPFADLLDAGPGDDFIDGFVGGDTIRGGSGEDEVGLYALQGAGLALVRSDLRGGDAVYSLDRADLAFDGITGVERFTDGVQTIDLADVPVFEPWAYAASHPDVARAVGTGGEALLTHFLEAGFFDGRRVTFDGGQYLENYADLRAAFGGDEEAAARHYVLRGEEEGRLPADPLAYVASFPDLAAAFGDLPPPALRTTALRHHERFGADEGRTDDVDFDPQAYLANYADLRAAFGGDEEAATLHYIRHGAREGRLAEDGLRYVASHDDIARAADARGLTTEEEVRAFAASHYRAYGREEGRERGIDFDADAYMSNYADLRSAFAAGEGGYDEGAAALHYVVHGLEEGRTDELILV